MSSKERLVLMVLVALAVLAPFAVPAVASIIQPGVIGPSGGRANPVYRRFWTETANTRGGTFGEPLYYEVDGGVVDAGVPVSDGGGFEPATGAQLRTPNAIITEAFCQTFEASHASWQYATGDDPVLGQIGEPGGANSAYLAATYDGILYLEVCDDSGDWVSYSTEVNTLSHADETVTACRAADGSWKLYVADANGQPVEVTTVTDGTGDGHWSALGQDLIMGAGPGFGYRCTCGDGKIDCLEVCDDSGTVAGDGCSATCIVEVGYVCTGEPSVCTLPCGDGDFDVGEECDDGNAVAADGCVSCLVEAGYQCVGSPSTCVTTCGDGITAGDEECDDGNLIDGDGCAADCTSEAAPLGYWASFSNSNYFVTPTANDPFDTAVANSSWTLCIGFKVTAQSSSHRLMLANSATGNAGFGAGIRSSSESSYGSMFMWGYNVNTAAAPAFDGTPQCLCIGKENGSSNTVAKLNAGARAAIGYSSVLEAVTGSAATLGRGFDGQSGLWYPATDISIGAVFLSHTSPTDSFLTTKVNDFLSDSAFDSEAGTTILCNGAEIGDACTVGGTAFNKVGSPTFTAL